MWEAELALRVKGVMREASQKKPKKIDGITGFLQIEVGKWGPGRGRPEGEEQEGMWWKRVRGGLLRWKSGNGDKRKKCCMF